MGNLPCCNPEEPHKPTAFSSSSNKNDNNQGFYSTSGIDGKSSSFQNNTSNLSSSNALQDATTSSDTNHIRSEHSTALDDANKIAMEERQRALLQEKERLQRIVNDASLNMVHVNGSNMRGMNAYYDPGYAADVWQDLIPGGGSTNTSNGRLSGGLIVKCGQIVPVQVHSVLNVPNSSSSSSSMSMEKRLSKQFTLNGVVDKEHVLALKEWLVSHPKSGSYQESTDVTATTSVVSTTTTTSTTTAKTTTTATTNNSMTTPSTSSPTETTGGSSEERIELLLDDLTEQFMAIVLAQQSGRQFDGVDPIVENVL